eukprot:2456787-Rhodomonas_salina.1
MAVQDTFPDDKALAELVKVGLMRSITARVVLTRSARAGRDGDGTTQLSSTRVACPIVLQLSYAMSGTEAGYAATRWVPRFSRAEQQALRQSCTTDVGRATHTQDPPNRTITDANACIYDAARTAIGELGATWSRLLQPQQGSGVLAPALRQVITNSLRP